MLAQILKWYVSSERVGMQLPRPPAGCTPPQPARRTLRWQRDSAVPLYGGSVRPDAVMKNWDYNLAQIQHCQLLVPKGSMSWSVTRLSAERCDFANFDRIAAFVFCNGMALCGHNLVWHGDSRQAGC